jgi:long-chain acyl-CoA synthetase
MSGIVKRLEFIASLIPDEAIALSSGGLQLTYASVLAEVQKRVSWLYEADSKVVALHLDNSIEWVLLDLACQEMGLVFIPLPAFFTADQIQQCVISAGVDTLLSDQRGLPDELSTLFVEAHCYLGSVLSCPIYVWRSPAPTRQNTPEGTQKITFTSGSTGSPKGVCLSVGQQWEVAQSLADTIGIKCPKHLCLLPLSTLLENIAGIYTPLLSGGEVVIPSDRDRGMLGSSELDSKALLDCIQSTQPMTMILVPQLLTLLVHACAAGWQPPATLAFIAVGGGRVSPRLLEQARSLGLPVYQGYGLSECGSVVALNTPSNDQLERVGHVLPHCQVSIESDEIVVSGAVHLGYLGDASSWYPEKIYTGDLGSLTNGFLSVDGRRKNILITSFGRNISPEWVESVLMSAPLFNQTVVLGDERPYLVALLVAPQQVSDGDIECWVNQCNKNLPDYAKLGRWVRVLGQDIQPYMTATGRPQREEIKQAFTACIDQLYLKESA